MPIKVAIIGLPFTGKTTLHSAISGLPVNSLPEISAGSGIHFTTLNYDFDQRLINIAKIYQSKKVAPINIEITDYPGFDFSSNQGRERVKRLLGEVRQMDLLMVVLRDFEDPNIPAYKNRIDPVAEINELMEEFVLADMEQLTRRIEKLESAIKKPTPERDQQKKELELVKKCLDALENNHTIIDLSLSAGEEKLLRAFTLLTQIPIIVIINVGENKIRSLPEYNISIEGQIKDIIICSAKIESELNQLEEDDKLLFMQDAGINKLIRDILPERIIKSLNMDVFYTANEREAHAWLIESGTKAIESAGKIHSDIARGFIRAEVIHYDDLIALGSEKRARESGKLRSEGKDYIVKDGDVILFRFNV